MSKSSKPLDIPLRGSKKIFVEIEQNLLSDEEDSVVLVVGKPVIYSKSVKKEIEIDTIYSLSPSPESNSFTSMSSLQSLPWEEEVFAPERLKSEDFSAPSYPLSVSSKEDITSVSLVSVTTSESTKESLSISLYAISEPISIPSSSKTIEPMVLESLQTTDLENNQKPPEFDYELLQEEQGITTIGDGYFIFQLDE